MTEPSTHFDPGNRAYQRFLTVASEFFDVGEWKREQDQQPVMMAITDVASGDMFTVALVDSHEDTAPHVLTAFGAGCEVTAHGVFDGAANADRYAPELVVSDGNIVATRSLHLHSPDVTELPAAMWTQMPPEVAQAAYPALVDGPAAIVVLIDRQHSVFCTVGPFPDDASADGWAPPTGTSPQVAHLVVALFDSAEAGQ